MEIIKDFDKIEPKGMEDFKRLPIGAYECIIKKAEVYKNPNNDKESFKVEIDIANGEYKDYFQNRFDSNNNMNKKWDNNATRYLAYQGDNVAYFKGFITSVENSNPGYKWDWEESKLIGKKICGVFQYEEYENQDGEKGVKVRLSKFRSLDKMKDIEVNDSVRKLDGSYVNFEDYKNATNKIVNDVFDGAVVTEDDVPFEI